MIQQNQSVSQETSLIFVHVPKAAGSTLNQVIQRQYNKESIFSIYGFQRSEREAETVEQFQALPEDRKRKIKLLRGHFKFGLHEYLPQDATYFTVLREPIERVISYYYYVLRRPEHYLHEQIKSQNLSLKECIISGLSTEFSNDQTRLLAGLQNPIVKYKDCPPEFLDIAKDNLQKYFTVAGLTERFDETLILFQKKLGWKLPFYIKENVTKDRPVVKDFSSDTLEVLRNYNSLDIELYNFAQDLFDRQIEQYKDTFYQKLNTFKLINNQYSRIYSLSRPIVSKIKAFSRRE